MATLAQAPAPAGAPAPAPVPAGRARRATGWLLAVPGVVWLAVFFALPIALLVMVLVFVRRAGTEELL